EDVAARRVPARDVLQKGPELRVDGLVPEFPGHVVEALTEFRPGGLVDRAGSEFVDVAGLLLAEGLVGLLLAREADDREIARQQAVASEVQQRRQELAPRQVAGGAKNDDRTGVTGPLGGLRRHGSSPPGANSISDLAWRPRSFET